jgi:cytochrome c oxidase assembly protein subunit 11
MSSYNVTPEKIAPYFNKIQCFCFQAQHLNPGQVVDLPVSFFVDPEIEKDAELDDLHTITLSYTYFEVKGDAKNQATQANAATNTAPNAAATANPPLPLSPNQTNKSDAPSVLPNRAPAS